MAMLVVVLAATLVGPATAQAEEPTERVLVRLAGARPAAALDAVLGQLDAGGEEAAFVDAYETIPWASLDVNADGRALLERSPTVLEVVADEIHTPALDSTVPIVQSDDVVDAGFDGRGQYLAVIDTGVQTSHPFIAGRTIIERCYSSGGDCPDGTTSQSGPGAAAPCTYAAGCEHGTHVAGIALGQRTSGSPAKGVAPGADLLAIQVFSEVTSSGASSPGAYTSDIVAALNWVNQQAIDGRPIAAVNLSLGSGERYSSPCDTSVYKSIFDSLVANGVAPVVSAGNDGDKNGLSSPACVSSAVSVAATTDADLLASYSNTSSYVDLSAPGSSVVSSLSNGSYGSRSGTSMAAPHVAGAFALLRQAAPATPVDGALASLRKTGAGVFLPVASAPRIDVLAATRDLVPTPGPPTSLVASVSDGAVDLSWTAPRWQGTSAPSGYEIHVAGTVRTTGADHTTVRVTGLDNGRSYTFSVMATNGAGASRAATVTTSAPVASGGGGGGGGGAPAPAPAPTTTTTTTVPPEPSGSTETPPPTTAPAPRTAAVPSPAVPVPGGVVTMRDGAIVTIAVPTPGMNVVAAATTPAGNGAWVVNAEGRVVGSGDAEVFGSIQIPLNKPIVGMASTMTGKGYWLLGADGGVFSFGDAAFHGSTGDRRLNQPVRALATTATGRGYWLLASDGGVFSFGDARFHGSTGNLRLNEPVAAMVATPTGSGYWLVARDGGVFTFGDARFVGAGGAGREVVAIAATPTGRGYHLLATDGTAVPYGDAVTSQS